jgi:hypothetical protein
VTDPDGMWVEILQDDRDLDTSAPESAKPQ